MIERSSIIERNKQDISKKKVTDKYKLSLDTQKFILQMCWAQHDAQWFLKCKDELGFRKANELNQRTLLAMGKIEARHIMNALNISKGDIRTMPEIFKLMNTIMDAYFPKIMKFKFVINSDKEGLGIVKKCFIWQMVQKSKGESEYECACNFRHKGWLKAAGIDGEIIPIKRISKGDDICEFKFVMND